MLTYRDELFQAGRAELRARIRKYFTGAQRKSATYERDEMRLLVKTRNRVFGRALRVHLSMMK